MSYTFSSMTREGNVQVGNVLHFQQHDQGSECPGGEMSHTSSSMTREGNVQEGKCPTLSAA